MNGVGFVGAGKMVSAIVKSLLHSSSFRKNELICCSANDGTSEGKIRGTITHILYPDQLKRLRREGNVEW